MSDTGNIVMDKVVDTLGNAGLTQSGFLTWEVDNRAQEYSYTPVELKYTTLFSPSTTSYTIPIITISGSEVKNTGNTSTAQPIDYTTSTDLTGSPSVSQAASQGLDLTSIIVPLGIIAGIAVVGVTAVNVFGGSKSTMVKKVIK